MTDTNPQNNANEEMESRISQQSWAAVWRTVAVTGGAVAIVLGLAWYSYAAIAGKRQALAAVEESEAKAVALSQQVATLRSKMTRVESDRVASVAAAEKQVAQFEKKLEDALQKAAVQAKAADKAQQSAAVLQSKLDQDASALRVQTARADKMESEVAALNTRTAGAARRIDALQVKLAAVDKEASSWKSRTAKAEAQAAELRNKLAVANKSFQSKLSAATASLESKLSDARKDASKWEERAADTAKELRSCRRRR